MTCQDTVQTKYMARLILLVGCLAVLLASAFALATTVAAQGPEGKGPMVPTTEFPEVGKLSKPASGEQLNQHCYDQYEPDDTMWQAGPLYPGYPRYRAFCYAWDRDIMRFTARAGTRYIIETFNLGWDADTVLELYDAGWRMVARNDDWEGSLASHIEWATPYGGTFYVLARQYNPPRAGPGAYYTIQMQEYPTGYNRVWVDRGCGAYYGIGWPIRVYMRVEGGYYSLMVNTAWGSRTVWSGYLSHGTYYLSGRVGSPAGAHTLILYDGFMNPSCTFHATYGANGNSTSEAFGDAAGQSPIELLSEAQPLDIKDGEW